MAKGDSIKASALRVPRFVHGLEAIAEHVGFSTEIHVGRPYSNSDVHLMGVWRGPTRAFLGLKFLPPSMLRRVHLSKTISITWLDRRHPIINGNAEVSRKGVEFELSFGALPRAIRMQGEIEITETSDGYQDWVIHHGTKEALIATKTCTKRQFPDKHWSKSDYTSLGWMTQRYPDGSFVHWRETEESAKRRHREREERCQHLQAPESAAQRAPDLSGFTSTENYRRALQVFVPVLIGRDPLGKLDGVKSTDGHVYGLTPESREEILDAIDELCFALCNAEVYRRKFDARTDEEKAAARVLLTKAEADPDFQHFLNRLRLAGSGGAQ